MAANPSSPEYPDFWVFTMQMGQWRFARDMNIPVLDITVKSGIKLFAPTWENLNAYRRQEIDSAEYTLRYLDKVCPTILTNPEEWRILEKHRTFALACYCAAGKFCHRHVFAALAVSYLSHRGHDVLFQGELVPHPRNPTTDHHEQD